LAKLEELRMRYLHASPQAKVQLSRRIERGAVGDKVKLANRYRCQICVELELPPIAFFKPDGTPYAEAHHIILVASLLPGALGPENVICVCPNHHRELHYGNASVVDSQTHFIVTISDRTVRIAKNGLSHSAFRELDKPANIAEATDVSS
jgi:predicted restriction endonuclease